MGRYHPIAWIIRPSQWVNRCPLKIFSVWSTTKSSFAITCVLWCLGHHSLFQAPKIVVKSRSVKRCKKKCEKRAGVGERQGSNFLPPPFPSRARLIFALLVLIRPHYTIWEPGTGYTNGKRDSGMKVTSPDLCEPFSKLWTDRFAHVNGKQPLSPGALHPVRYFSSRHFFTACLDFPLPPLYASGSPKMRS